MRHEQLVCSGKSRIPLSLFPSTSACFSVGGLFRVQFLLWRCGCGFMPLSLDLYSEDKVNLEFGSICSLNQRHLLEVRPFSG